MWMFLDDTSKSDQPVASVVQSCVKSNNGICGRAQLVDFRLELARTKIRNKKKGNKTIMNSTVLHKSCALASVNNAKVAKIFARFHFKQKTWMPTNCSKSTPSGLSANDTSIQNKLLRICANFNTLNKNELWRNWRPTIKERWNEGRKLIRDTHKDQTLPVPFVSRALFAAKPSTKNKPKCKFLRA